jgi:hypothetical protein
MSSSTRAFAEAVAGAASAVFSILVCYPLDIAKTQVQAGRKDDTANAESSNNSRIKSRTIRTLLKIYQDTGLIGLWSGVGFKVLATAVSSFIYFYVYSWLKVRFYGNQNYHH